MNAPPHRLLVTGATGFVGTALVDALRTNAAFELTCAVRIPSSLATSAPQIVVGNMSGETNWRHAVTGMHTVVHLAARVHVMRESTSNPLAEFRRVNVDATLALARQAAEQGVRRLVYLSSIKVNGESGVFTERDTPAPTDPYGISKNEAEMGLRTLAGETGLEVVIIRPPLVYGPGVKANFRSLLRLVSRGVPLPLGAVHNKRSFVAVQNLSHFILHCAAHAEAANQTFLVSDGHDLSTTELVQRMGRAAGRPARLIPVPAWLMTTAATVLGKGAVTQRLLGSLQLDISKARELLHWAPPLGVDEALRLVVAAP